MRQPSSLVAERFEAEHALAVFACAWLAFVVGGAALPRDAAGMVGRQLLFLAAPPLVFALALRAPVRPCLGLVRARPPALLGAALVGVSFWVLNLTLVVPLVRAMFDDPARLAALERSVPWAEDGAVTRLLAVVLVPALCEELLLRGAVARALVPRIGRIAAVAGSAALFAALHLPPERMLPAAAFGLVLGFAAVATDSAIPAIVMHAFNNLLVVVVLPAVPALGDALSAHPLPIATLSLALTAAGLALLARSPAGPMV